MADLFEACFGGIASLQDAGGQSLELLMPDGGFAGAISSGAETLARITQDVDGARRLWSPAGQLLGVVHEDGFGNAVFRDASGIPIMTANETAAGVSFHDPAGVAFMHGHDGLAGGMSFADPSGVALGEMNPDAFAGFDVHPAGFELPGGLEGVEAFEGLDPEAFAIDSFELPDIPDFDFDF